MSDRPNYAKKYGYKHQEKYAKAHYHTIAVKIPIAKKEELDALACERGVSINYLVKESILQTYGIDCFTQK